MGTSGENQRSRTGEDEVRRRINSFKYISTHHNHERCNYGLWYRNKQQLHCSFLSDDTKLKVYAITIKNNKLNRIYYKEDLYNEFKAIALQFGCFRVVNINYEIDKTRKLHLHATIICHVYDGLYTNIKASDGFFKNINPVYSIEWVAYCRKYASNIYEQEQIIDTHCALHNYLFRKPMYEKERHIIFIPNKHTGEQDEVELNSEEWHQLTSI